MGQGFSSLFLISSACIFFQTDIPENTNRSKQYDCNKRAKIHKPIPEIVHICFMQKELGWEVINKGKWNNKNEQLLYSFGKYTEGITRELARTIKEHIKNITRSHKP